ARAAAQQLHRFRHASVGSCRPHEYPELVVAALDVASVLEERLADAEQRLSQLLRSVEFLEELRELFQSRSPKFAIRPPPFQKPPTTRPQGAPQASSPAPSSLSTVEARLAKLDAELQQTLKVPQIEEYLEAERAATTAQLEDFAKVLHEHEVSMAKVVMNPSTSLQKREEESRPPFFEEPLPKLLEGRHIKAQLDDFNQSIVGLRSDLQVLAAQTEWRLGALEKVGRIQESAP
ncbi:Uncharacterized protein SCF082_LOCUS38504, partial [Durusdinium trenchii]